MTTPEEQTAETLAREMWITPSQGVIDRFAEALRTAVTEEREALAAEAGKRARKNRKAAQSPSKHERVREVLDGCADEMEAFAAAIRARGEQEEQP